MQRSFREKYSFWIIAALLALAALAAFISYTIFAVPLLLAVVLLGLDIIYVNAKGMAKCRDAKTWPTTNATLVRGDAEYRRYDGTKRRWYLSIEYRYSVEGMEYTNTNYNWIGKVSVAKESIDRLIDDLKRAEGFKIRFNPVDHSEAVVVLPLPLIYVVGITVGALLVLGGVFGALAFFGIVAFDWLQ